MVIEIQGDVFKAKEHLLIHGCNCLCTWGKGVAKTMLNLYPEAFYTVDMMTRRGDKNKLGSYTWWQGRHHYYDQDIKVINLYSQYDLWTRHAPKTLFADYDAIRKGLTDISEAFPENSIAMPRIGAGLAGGDWNIIKEIIEDVFKDDDRLVKIYFL